MSNRTLRTKRNKQRRKGNGQAATNRILLSSLKNHPIFGSDQFKSNHDSIPSAWVDMQMNSTFCDKAGSVTHPLEGIDGTRFKGCQPLTDFVTTATNNNLFTNNTLATASPNYIALNPDSLNGPLSAIGNLYDKYVFRDILIEVISNVATTQAGSMALAVVSEGSSNLGPTSFALARQVVPSVTSPFRADRTYLHYHYDGSELFFNKYDFSTEADARLTNQAGLFGFPSATSIGAITMAYSNVWFIVDMYQPVSTQGFAVMAKSKEEYQKLNWVLAALRQTESPKESVMREEKQQESKILIPDRLKPSVLNQLNQLLANLSSNCSVVSHSITKGQ